jgi:hypothetical protein
MVCLLLPNQRCSKCLSIDRCSIREKDKKKTGEYEKYSIHLFLSKSEEMVFNKLIIVFVLCILIFNAAAIIKEAYANSNNSSSSNQVTIVPPGKVYAPPAPTNQDIINYIQYNFERI